ncbi:embryo-specific protein ATS3B-like [Abrus precatorius]|uniref:Embryo-specific protein ATS3B-like n=1 Tax=Abrus precatorius TaxID=3816 RepID=A0A8B8LT09_ABRPR|nr:embryo-specific protein ATS3B-like [Abrus precatorius]
MIKNVLLLLLFCFAYGVTLSLSESKYASVQPHAAESFSVGYIQMTTAANCSYLVVITTSCSSPKFTTDKIGIAFGDAYGNQVYEPRLDNPIAGTFEQCSSDSFQIDGECASPICFVYLYRSGAEYGWKPDSVKIYGYDSEPVTFNFNESIPNGTWYGYDNCVTPPPPPSSSYQLSPKKWVIISMVIGFVLSFWM